jgi:rRNA small subunit pseudouridine methyltransferase Nep1
MKVNVVLTESALELVPKEIRNHPAVKKDAERRGKETSEILLDRSIHHAAMLKLKDSQKRGRPDLVHIVVLSVTGSPMYADGLVKLYIHTLDDKVIDVKERTMLPKNYFRFRNLMEQCLAGGDAGELVSTSGGSIKEIVSSIIGTDYCVALSTEGTMSDPSGVGTKVADRRNPAILIGGFPHGHFSQTTMAVADDVFRIHRRALEAHVVASRVLYEIERLATENR